MVFGAAAMQPAEASCSNLRLVTTQNTFSGYYTYIYTPGVTAGVLLTRPRGIAGGGIGGI